MIKCSIAAVLLAIGSAILMLQSDAQARQAKQDLYFINSTGHTIIEIYISPHSRATWGQNRIEHPLSAEQKTHFTFESSQSCAWDIAFVTDDGVRWQETSGYNFCRVAAIAVDGDGGMAGLDGKGEVVALGGDPQ